MAYHYGLPEIARAPNEMKALHSWGRTELTAASSYKADEVDGGFKNKEKTVSLKHWDQCVLSKHVPCS